MATCIDVPVELDARALVQGIPPLHREIDDRQVHDADEREQRRRAVAAARILEGVGERDEAEVEEEQHQLGGHARVPRPSSAPGGRPQKAPVQSATKVKSAPGGRDRARHHRRERVLNVSDDAP
jgi:hypothetical protein